MRSNCDQRNITHVAGSLAEYDREVVIKAKLPSRVRRYVDEFAIGPYHMPTIENLVARMGEDGLLKALAAQQRAFDVRDYGPLFPEPGTR